MDRGELRCYITLVIVGGLVITATMFVGGSIFFPQIVASAFDVTPTVDTAKVTNSNSKAAISQQYRFGEPQMKSINYSDGWAIPTVTMSIELWNQTTSHWEVVGYTNTHLHKVKVDNTDKQDLSIGHTDRFNPKVPTGND